ncbi:MAG: putative peptide zinc metalloprotease protein [Halieaceae bacterium]|jgi:putative peptide zinc metalloprotease protein
MSVFSKNWYQVEGLKPRLKPQISISRQEQRGERKYALRDPISGSIQQYSEQAYTVLGLMDGERTLGEIWLLAGDLLKDELPTQEDMISLLSSLYQMDMLYLDIPVNAVDLHRRLGKKQQAKQLQRVYSPLAVTIPLLDPTRILDVLCPIIDLFMGKFMLFVYLLVVGAGVTTAVQNFDALTANGADKILALDNLFLMWVLYPVLKIVHELGHAYTVRRYGGDVHEVGVMFLVLFPMPYVNASESASFSSKHQRIAVAAAGLIVEFFLASLAVILWSMASDGLVKAIMYNLAFMAGVSTLLFNGNPLLKFDAYYMLSDYLEIPNMAKRGTAYWGYLIKKWIFRFRDLEDPSVDSRERYWLFFYNLFSFAYRMFISVTIILFVGSKYFIVGALLGIWTLMSGWIIPLVKTLAKPFHEPQFVMRGSNPKLIMALLALLTWVILFVVPMPHTFTAEGVTWTEESERLYAGESGFVTAISIPDDGQVVEGQQLLTLVNHELIDRSHRVSGQVAEARARARAVYEDRTKANLAAAEIVRFEDELADINLAIGKMKVVTLAEGRAIFQEPDTLDSRFLRRGEVIGFVLHPERPLIIRVAVAETAAEQVLNSVTDVSLRSASRWNVEIPGVLASVVPRVSKEIPSPIMTIEGGGDIALDPSSGEKMEAVENYVTIEVQVPGLPMDYVFERFFVRFELPPASLAQRLYREIRQVFLEKFEV